MSEVARYKAIIVDADRTIREQADRIEALEAALQAIINHPPGSAHRIARQALGEVK